MKSLERAVELRARGAAAVVDAVERVSRRLGDAPYKSRIGLYCGECSRWTRLEDIGALRCPGCGVGLSMCSACAMKLVHAFGRCSRCCDAGEPTATESQVL
jgi:hypothetical protein